MQKKLWDLHNYVNWLYLILWRTQKPLENKKALTVKGILLCTDPNDNQIASNCRNIMNQSDII